MAAQTEPEGTSTGPVEVYDEEAQRAELFRDLGIDGTRDGKALVGASDPNGPPADGRAYDPDDPGDEEPEIEAAEIEPEPTPAPPAAEADEENPASLAFRLREESRARSDAERKLAANDAYVAAILAGLALEGRGGGAAAPAPGGDQPVAPPDLFTDPDGWAQHKFGELSRPLHEKIERLEQENAQLRGEHQQGRREGAHRQVMGEVQAYEAQNPGFNDRVDRYREEFQRDLVEQGVAPEDADVLWKREFAGMLTFAKTRGLSFPAFVDRAARRFLGDVGAAPAAPSGGRPAGRPATDGRIAAAQRVQADGAATSATQGGGVAASAEALRKSGLSPAAVTELLSQGASGRRQFFDHMKNMEGTR